MTTYYVRKTGSDSNNGLSKSAAFLTVGHGIATIAAGDTLYVGAGTYRETMTSTNKNGSAGSHYTVKGDWDGSQTGDAGEVVITAFLTNEITTPSTNASWQFTTSSYWDVSHITFVGGGSTDVSAICTPTAGSNVHNLTFTDCTMFGRGTSDAAPVLIILSSGVSFASTFTRCRIIGCGRAVYISQNGTVVDAATTFRNCLIFANVGYVADVNPAGGITFDSCTFLGGGFNAGTGSLTSPAGMTIRNSVGLVGPNGVDPNEAFLAAAAGQIDEDYNLWGYAFGFIYGANVTQGTHTHTDVDGYDLRWLWGQEQSYGAVLRPFATPVVGSPILGFGADPSHNATTDDLLGGIRPGSGIGSVAKTAGALERANSGTKNVSVTHTAPQSLNINGPGYQDFELPVLAGTTTVSVWVRFDATYAGTLPQLLVKNGGEAGVADASVTATGSANTWGQISLSISPTAAGIVTVRFQSNDTNGAGQSYFADFGTQ